MPWSAKDMAAKGAKRPAYAAKIANGLLAKGRSEGSAIRIALHMANKGKNKKRK